MLRRWSAERALEHWQDSKLLTKKKAQQLRESLELSDPELPSRALSIFSFIGAILLGLGVILFFASNWSQMTPMIKEAVLMVGLLTSGWTGYVLVYEKQTYLKVGSALLFLNLILFGASIFLVAQMYHLQLNFWLGMLLWTMGAVIFAYILQSQAHMWLAVPLFLLFLGWLRADLITGFGSQLGFVFEDAGFFGMLPAIGAGLIGLSMLSNDRIGRSFASPTFFSWGLFLVIIPVVVSTANSYLLFHFFELQTDSVAMVTLVLSALLVLFALWKGNFHTEEGKKGLIALVAYIAFIHVLAYLPVMMGIPLDVYWYGAEKSFMLNGLHAVHVVMSFVLLLTVIWFGTLLRQATIINMGMISMALLILIQYFSLGYSLQNRSLFFMGGGVLLIVLSVILEKNRQRILRSFTSVDV